jgi:membrane-bound serine protease (ClpP class)
MRRLISIFFLGAAVLVTPHASAKTATRVEVVSVSGLIDGPAEKAITGTIAAAVREHSKVVVVEIDSRGGLDRNRALRLVDAIRGAPIPVVAWVGPPGARAENAAALLVLAAKIPALAPGTHLGPIETLDMHTPAGLRSAGSATRPDAQTLVDRGLTATAARKAKLVRVIEPSLTDLLQSIDGTRVVIGDKAQTLRIDPSSLSIHLHGIGLFGRVLHAAAQPSITYLLLLLALVGVLFELFHPSNGPAGVSGLLALGLALYGTATLGGSWIGFGLVVLGVVGFAVDLRYENLGAYTIVGFAALVVGSLLLFSGPWLRVSPLVLAFGIASMVAFLLGAMTRVLRDLRAVARGELEVTDAHPHPNGGDPHAP